MTAVRYLAPAFREFERAVDRYFERSPRIARAFADEVFRALDQLRVFPESAPYLLPPVRRKVLRKYPFSVLYYLKDGHLVVVAIMHQRQPPEHWVPRVK